MHSFKLGSNHIIVIIQTGRKLRKSHAKILEKLCKHLKNKNCCNFMSSQYNFLSSYIKNPSNEMYHFDIQVNSKMKLPKHNPLNKTILRSLSCKCYEESNRKECLLQISATNSCKATVEASTNYFRNFPFFRPHSHAIPYAS